jgi:hypothetical protein
VCAAEAMRDAQGGRRSELTHSAADRLPVAPSAFKDISDFLPSEGSRFAHSTVF